MDPGPGQEHINVLGCILGVGLALLLLVLFGYTIFRCYQQRQGWHRPDFIFSLYHSRGLRSVAVELAAPFSISGSLGQPGGGYVHFHQREL